MILLGVIAGVLVVLMGIQLAKWLDQRARRAEVASRDSNSLAAITFSVTGVSGDLVPLVSGIRHGADNSRIDLFGEDGGYIQLERKGQDWMDGMRRWIDDGWNVTYTILFPDKTTTDLLLALIEDVGEDALTVYIVDDAKDTSAVNDLIEERRTFHPNLIYDGLEGKGMWIEGTHMAGSEYAYNVEYVSPSAMTVERQREFDQYEAENVSIRKCCKRLRPVAATAARPQEVARQA